MSLKSPRKIDKMVISDDVSVQVDLIISTTIICIFTIIMVIFTTIICISTIKIIYTTIIYTSTIISTTIISILRCRRSP